MAVVDYEAAWLDLQTYVLQKRSHGQSDLVLRMAEIERDRRVPEGQEGFDPTPLRQQGRGLRPA